VFSNLTYTKFYAQYYFESRELHRPLGPNQWSICNVRGRRGLLRKVLIQRQAGSKVVTRIQSIPPKIGELFYVRVLLQHRPAFSFEDLRTIHNRLYATYQEAAIALGLFEDESEAVRAMREAIEAYSRPGQLRFLFAHLLLDLPTPAITLWENFREALSADFALDHNEDESIRLTLQAISRYLRSQGASLCQFGLPEPVRVDQEVNMELDAFLYRRDTLLQQSQESYRMMNTEQRSIYDHIFNSIGTGGCCFLDGKAGRGKTFLVNAICNRIRGEGRIACITGSTALSVTLYERGRTAHSMFGIPVQENSSDLVSKISIFSGRAEVLRRAVLIVWEEFPMANKAAIECVDSLLRQIMRNDLPFGNKTFLALGDFQQVAPVLRDVTAPAAVFDSSIRSSSLWEHFHILRLTHPIRNAGDPTYADWVDRVGDGVLPFDRTVSLHHLSQVRSMDEAADFLFRPEILACLA
jgi:PIF1-like helicase